MTPYDANARRSLPLEGPHAGRRAGKAMSIVLIDRRPLTRQCLVRWLQDGSPDLHVTPLGSPVELIDSRRASSDHDIIIFSIAGASVTDPETLAKIALLRRRMGRVPLVLLSDRDDIDEIVEAIEHGARGYVPTSLEPAEAAAALQCVAAGGTFIPAGALLKVAHERGERPMQGAPGRSAIESLTRRERQVLARLRQGKPNKVIAYELEISESTVKVFVRRILMKLNASNRTQVATLTAVGWNGHDNPS